MSGTAIDPLAAMAEEMGYEDENEELIVEIPLQAKPSMPKVKHKKEKQQSHKEERVVVKTNDGRKTKVNKRLLASESLFFRSILAGRFAMEKDEATCIPFTYDMLKACVRYIEDLRNDFTPHPDLQTSVDILDVACFLRMENVVEALTKHIVSTVGNAHLVTVYHFALSRHPPLANSLWTLIIKRFRKIYQSCEYLLLDDVEMSTALNDDRLNILMAEESDAITKWLQKHTSDNERVRAISQTLRNVVIPGRRPADIVRPRRNNSTIVAIGGTNNDSTVQGTVQAFNDREQLWEPVQQRFQIHPVAFHGTAIVNKQLFVYGGFNTNEYLSSCTALNLNTGVWTPMANMIEHRSYCGSAEYTDSYGTQFAMAIGGYNGLVRLRNGEIYNPTTESWSMLPNMKSVRSDLACTIVGEKLFAIGGFDGETIHGHCEMFDFGAQKWLLPRNAKMSKTRCAPCAITYDRNIAVVLGGYSGGRRLRSVETYDIREGIWHSLRSFHMPRSNFGAALLDERLVIAGGYTGRDTIADSEIMDLRIDFWMTLPALASPKSALKLVTLEECDIIEQLVPYSPEEGYVRVEFPPLH